MSFIVSNDAYCISGQGATIGFTNETFGAHLNATGLESSWVNQTAYPRASDLKACAGDEPDLVIVCIGGNDGNTSFHDVYYTCTPACVAPPPPPCCAGGSPPPNQSSTTTTTTSSGGTSSAGAFGSTGSAIAQGISQLASQISGLLFDYWPYILGLIAFISIGLFFLLGIGAKNPRPKAVGTPPNMGLPHRAGIPPKAGVPTRTEVHLRTNKRSRRSER